MAATISSEFTLPDDVIAVTGTLTATIHGDWAKDTDGSIRVDPQSWEVDETTGVLTVELPAGGYNFQFKTRSGRTPTLTAYYELADATTYTWGDIFGEPMTPPPTPSQVTQVLTARDEAVAAAAAAEAVGDTNDTVIAGRINDPASATSTALSAAYGTRAGYRVALLGASITANNGDSTLVNNPTGGATAHGPSTLGIVRWANMLLGQSMDVVTNVSQGGLTSAQILTNTPDALTDSPDWVIGHDWWVNDILTGVSAATSQANINSIIDTCNNAGATVILTDYLPLAVYDTAAKIAQHHAMMDWLHTRQNRGFILLPVCDLIFDPANGKPLSWATYDGSHPSVRGAHAMGLVMAQRLAPLFPGRALQPVAISALNGSGYMGNPRELALNPPPFAVAGAGLAYGFSLSGTATPAGSKVAATDAPNQMWQRVTFGTDGTAVVTIGLQTGSGLSFTGSGGTITLQPGVTKTQMQFEYRIPAASAPGKWVDVTGYQYYSPASDSVYALQDTSSVGQDQGYTPDDSRIYLARSPAWVMPVGSTSMAAAIVLYGQAGAVVDLRRVSVAVV